MSFFTMQLVLHSIHVEYQGYMYWLKKESDEWHCLINNFDGTH